MSEFMPCGGCGAESPKDRCIGCMHDFGEKHVQQVSEQWSAAISKLGLKTVEQVVDENTQLRERVAELETRIKDCLFWFNADGSPVDGPRFREEFDKLRALVGYDRDKVHDFSYRHKK